MQPPVESTEAGGEHSQRRGAPPRREGTGTQPGRGSRCSSGTNLTAPQQQRRANRGTCRQHPAVPANRLRHNRSSDRQTSHPHGDRSIKQGVRHHPDGRHVSMKRQPARFFSMVVGHRRRVHLRRQLRSWLPTGSRCRAAELFGENMVPAGMPPNVAKAAAAVRGRGQQARRSLLSFIIPLIG